MTSWDDAAESKMELMMCQRVTQFSVCPDFPPPNLNPRMCSRSRGRRQWDRRARRQNFGPAHIKALAERPQTDPGPLNNALCEREDMYHSSDH